MAADAAGAAYAAIDGTGRANIARALAEGRRDVVGGLARRAADGAAALGGDRRARVAEALTSLLHYLLAAAAVPSQRKVEAGGTTVDVAIPDARALLSSPRDAVLVCVPGARPEPARELDAAMAALQPHPDNLWYVTEGAAPGRAYSVGGGTFGGLVFDAAEFAASRWPRRLSALGSPGAPGPPPP